MQVHPGLGPDGALERVAEVVPVLEVPTILGDVGRRDRVVWGRLGCWGDGQGHEGGEGNEEPEPAAHESS